MFNTSLQKDKAYVDMVKAENKKTVSQYSTSNNDTEPVITISNPLLFEMIKLNIRGVTIPYCSKLKKKKEYF